MKKKINRNKENEEIKKNIDELRDVLNEICATAEDTESLKKRLIISEHLDQLIVKYINGNNE